MKHIPLSCPPDGHLQPTNRPSASLAAPSQSSAGKSLLARKTTIVLSSLLLIAGVSEAQTTIAGWDFTGLTAYGASPQTATSASPNVAVVGLTRGSGVTTTPTAAGSAWGGNGWNEGTDLATAISNNNVATFTLTPNAGYKMSLAAISAYNVRRSGTGPTTGQWQYSTNGTTFTNIGSAITWGATTSATGNLQAAIDLSAVTALQNVAAGTTVTFRIANYTSSAATGTWYFNNYQTGNDLEVTGTVAVDGADTTPPTAASLSPLDGATGVPIGSNLVVSFSENVVTIPAATGTIEIHKADTSLVASYLITDPAVTVSGNTLTINPTADLAYSTGYYVTIPAGLVEDAAGNDFAGLTVPTAWDFTTEAAPLPPSVVINKYLNSTTDLVELLVVGTGVTGTTLDMRGMIIKDFSSNMTGDNGGKYVFSTDTLWSAVPVGTLIVLSKSAVTSDTNAADYNLSVGLDDTTYFTSGGGTFDISTTEMVMIKAAGSGNGGTTGGIHALAGGTAGSFFTSFLGPKLISTGTSGAGVGVVATNSTSAIADFTGTDATSPSLTSIDFGVPHNLTNLTYVYALRGTVPGDGAGIVTLTNATAGPLSGINIFEDSQTDNQSVQLALNAQLPSVTLTDIVITVPAAMGAPAGATVTGAGAGTPSISIVGQTVTISGTAVTNVNTVAITLTGLDTPVTTAADNGNYGFTVQTAKSGGTPTNISIQPVARVTVPIEAIRDVNASGVPLDLGTIVAVRGVCTEAQFYTTNTLGFLQQGGFGVCVFNSNPATPFVRGKSYAVLGTVSQFNGVTQVTLGSLTAAVDLGVAAEPAPLVATIPALLANPEIYEGRLVTIETLTQSAADLDVWASGATITMVDTASPVPNSIDIVIASSSGAVTGPGGPATITGIFSQSDTTSPFTSAYQLLPREQADIQVLGSGYGLWIDGYFPGVTDANIVGFNADPDGDGILNGVEALIGGNPNAQGVFATTELTKSGNTFTFLYPQNKVLPNGMTASYRWSTDLVNWQPSGGSFGGATVTLTDLLWDDTGALVNIYKVTATVTAGTVTNLYIRVAAQD